MSEDSAGSSKAFDPFEQFREMRDGYLDAMAKLMVDVVNTDAYAQASGAMLENSLTLSVPFREAMEKSMLQVLQQLSMPSRQDIVAFADRFTTLEMRLDDMDAKLDRIEKQNHVAPVPKEDPAQASGSNVTTESPMRVPARSRAAKQAQAKKRIARKVKR